VDSAVGILAQPVEVLAAIFPMTCTRTTPVLTRLLLVVLPCQATAVALAMAAEPLTVATMLSRASRLWFAT
jgi:hypothetical protein